MSASSSCRPISVHLRKVLGRLDKEDPPPLIKRQMDPNNENLREWASLLNLGVFKGLSLDRPSQLTQTS